MNRAPCGRDRRFAWTVCQHPPSSCPNGFFPVTVKTASMMEPRYVFQSLSLSFLACLLMDFSTDFTATLCPLRLVMCSIPSKKSEKTSRTEQNHRHLRPRRENQIHLGYPCLKIKMAWDPRMTTKNMKRCKDRQHWPRLPRSGCAPLLLWVCL